MTTGTASVSGKIFARNREQQNGVDLRHRLWRHDSTAASAFRRHGAAVWRLYQVLRREESDNRITAGLHAFPRDSAAGYEGLAGWFDDDVRGVFPVSDESALGKFPPGVSQSRSTADPENILQIAKTAGTFLQIRLKVVCGVLISAMALLLLKLLGDENERGSSTACIVRENSLNNRRYPASCRASSRLVCTVISFAASSRHSASVRTLCPTSSPISHNNLNPTFQPRLICAIYRIACYLLLTGSSTSKSTSE